MAELGEGLEIDKKKTTTPPVLDKAKDVLSKAAPKLDLGAAPAPGTLGGDLTKTERERVFEAQAKPYTDAMSKYFEGQGLRWSSERADKTAQQITSNVVVPMLQSDREYGLQTRGLDLQERSINQAAEQFAAQLGLDKEKLAETARQFDTSTETQRQQFAADLGIRRDQLNETMRQFNADLAQRQSQFVAEMDLAKTNAAFERASNSYDGRDPITGLTVDSLQARNAKLNERVQRAAATGKWIENDVEVNALAILAAAGVDVSEFLDMTPEQAATVAARGNSAADSAVSELTEMERQAQFISQLPTWTQRLNVPGGALQTLVEELGVDVAQPLFERLSNGERIPYGEFSQIFGGGERVRALYAIADHISVELDAGGNVTSVYLPNVSGPADNGGGGTNNDLGGDDVAPAQTFDDVLSVTGSNYRSDQINNARTVFRHNGYDAAVAYLQGLPTTNSGSSSGGGSTSGGGGGGTNNDILEAARTNWTGETVNAVVSLLRGGQIGFENLSRFSPSRRQHLLQRAGMA